MAKKIPVGASIVVTRPGERLPCMTDFFDLPELSGYLPYFEPYMGTLHMLQKDDVGEILAYREPWEGHTYYKNGLYLIRVERVPDFVAVVPDTAFYVDDFVEPISEEILLSLIEAGDSDD